MLRISGLACGLVLASAGMACAQVTTTEVQTAAPTGAPAPGEVQRFSQILGSTVQLQGVDNFGRVEDAVIDPNGSIAYLVVSSNGRNVMLPWGEGRFNYGQRVVTYGVTPQQIQPLFFQASAWPNVWGTPYMKSVRQVFPRAGVLRREVLRPAMPDRTIPPGAAVNPGGAPLPTPAGTVVAPGGVIDEKVKVRPDGSVKVKERVR